MTFEERIRELCLRSNMVYERILSLSCEKDLYILCPLELADEQILKDNIPKMLKVIREYIHESETYLRCMDKSKEFYFNSQMKSFVDEAHNHQEKVDELAEIMNEGISPYVWYYYEAMDGYIVCLDKT